MKTMEKHSSAISYITSGGWFSYGALTLNDIAMIVGIVTGLGTFVVNWYYKRKEFKLREQEVRRGPKG